MITKKVTKQPAIHHQEGASVYVERTIAVLIEEVPENITHEQVEELLDQLLCFQRAVLCRLGVDRYAK